MKRLASGKVRARTLVERDLLPKLRIVAADEGVVSYSRLVADAIDGLNEGERLPPVAPSPDRGDAQQAEFAIDEKAWRKLRITAVRSGRSRQGLLRDIMVEIAQRI